MNRLIFILVLTLTGTSFMMGRVVEQHTTLHALDIFKKREVQLTNVISRCIHVVHKYEGILIGIKHEGESRTINTISK